MTAHELAKELLEGPDLPVLLSSEFGLNKEAVGTSPYLDLDPDDEEDGVYQSWDFEELKPVEKRGPTVTII